MSLQSARDFHYPGEPLLNKSIVKGMNMEDVTKVLAKAIELVYAGQSLECLDLKAFGITCPPEDKTLICAILETLLKSQLELGKRLGVINGFFTNVKESTNSISDEKVKVLADSAAAKFLGELIKGTPGRVAVTKEAVTITGLVPVGTRAFINPNRKGDFDNNGKGKVGTDLEGWAIRDGRNGLDNALGRFPMYTDTLENAGKKAGSNAIKVLLANIESFELPVTGEIKEALAADIEISIPINTRWSGHSTSGSYANKLQIEPNNANKLTAKFNAKHTHSHTLSVKHTNPQPKDISIIPEHIKEIPIEFIG